MRIGINARYLENANTGIAKYLSHLITNLKKIDSGNEYVLFFGSDKDTPKTVSGAGFDCDISRMPTTNQILKFAWAHSYLPYAIGKKRLDLFHESSFVAPLIKRCPTVITIYDVAYLRIPECYTYGTRLYFKCFLSANIRQADLVITISENSKKDIIESFNVKPDKVRVIYPGTDEAFQRLDDHEEPEKVRQIYGIKRDYILAVSGMTPRKNYVTLIRAFKHLKQQRKVGAQLVIVGRKSWWYEEVFRETLACGLEKDIIFCGCVPKEHLLRLYNAAAVFAHPSLYEGFGLPILEAMACGCPVIASDTSSMPETCGNAALLVDPKDVEGLSNGIYKLMTEDSLRKDLIKKGMEQAKKFSWKKVAEETLAAYTAAAGRGIS